MVYVPAGEFLMGSPDGEGHDDEHPQHRVTLDEFWIDRTEVTNEQYRQCVEAGACDAPTSCNWGWSIYDDGEKGDDPVLCVNWHNADAYCGWAGARLPTEAEWEKAARGTAGQVYPWGDQFDGSRVNSCDVSCEDDRADGDWDDGYARTAPVGSYPAGASPYGALDMTGNVLEWVADWYDADYYRASPGLNPQGPATGNYNGYNGNVLRGGSWYDTQEGVRSAARNRLDPFGVTDNIGFRCCVS